MALDLDGTFLDNHHQISAANAKAVEILRQHGVRIALVTGRRFRNVARIVRQYGLGDLMIVHNGALVRNCDTEELIYFQELERAVCRDIIGASRWLQQSPFVLVDPLQTRVFFESQACENQARSQYLARNAGDSFGVADLTEVLTAGPVIQLLFTDAILALQECKTHLMDQFGDRAT
ncbi:MAG: HAD-IIB family hydrolase, partial [Acidobacteria bacterium]|nr:HAD-IIB family hydrolase [Acidobacteriota bacterium]